MNENPTGGETPGRAPQDPIPPAAPRDPSAPAPPSGLPSPEPSPAALLLDRLLGRTTGRAIAFALLAPIAAFVVGLSCFFLPVVGQILCIAFGLGPGLTQLLYLVPIDRYAARHGLAATRRGLWIGASVIFLLNSGCWGVMMFTLKGTDFR